MRDSILYFFLLVLEISFVFTPNVVYKQNRFPKTFYQKDLKFVLKEKSNPITFDWGLILLLIEVNLILKKQNCKKYIFMAFDSSSLKIGLILLTKIILFYTQIYIV